jgi:hypothetical protein
LRQKSNCSSVPFSTRHPVIFVKDVEPMEMEYLLQFIYRGEVDIPSTELDHLVEIAKELGIVGEWQAMSSMNLQKLKRYFPFQV